jgi:hypothetical protein
MKRTQTIITNSRKRGLGAAGEGSHYLAEVLDDDRHSFCFGFVRSVSTGRAKYDIFADVLGLNLGGS